MKRNLVKIIIAIIVIVGVYSLLSHLWRDGLSQPRQYP